MLSQASKHTHIHTDLIVKWEGEKEGRGQEMHTDGDGLVVERMRRDKAHTHPGADRQSWT